MSERQSWSQEEKKQHLNFLGQFWSEALDNFVSWRPDPEAWGVNAFVLNWKHLGALYLFIPMILIGRTLSNISEDMIEVAIIVVPFWASRPWWPLLLQLLIHLPTLLPHASCLLTNRNGESHPQITTKQIKMLTCLISGNYSQAEEIQLDIQKSSPKQRNFS
ncbi:Reverse transcriptase/ribonuclease h/methyltransferase [Oopsacas minuta]|uniref:Reverse transcriptase/ribonuclease h/methyltransferase n=1 Tax=Oopsacas minuta TaxID=111878 RepID=A0AAV7KHW6_9METZ|nr:Reverse transcriptase/ribonuclease h/methyltransferase [Oopsacas minuta]